MTSIPTPAVTVRDIAKLTGFSTGTISRALKNEPGLTEETRQTVLAAARDLGYDFGKLRTKRLRRIVFLLHSQHNTVSSSHFYSPVLHGAEEACRKLGIVLSFMAMGKPMALIDMRLRGYSSVNPENMLGGFLAAQHLISIGRTRIGLICGPLSHYSIRERARGFRRALFEANILADPQLEETLPDGLSLEEGAWEAMQALLDLPVRPDSVFCYNDSAALVAMRCCLAAGLKVPHDISIVGFDDTAAAVLGHRPLTTLRIDKKELGTMGVELLLRSQTEPFVEAVSPVRLIIRASTVCK
jgi:DNA-binding LacI/PurR family transcriptional regulator